MKIKRQQTWDAFFAKWCPECGKATAMEPHRTGLPGISVLDCPECNMRWQFNFLESEDDELEVDDHLRMMPAREPQPHEEPK